HDGETVVLGGMISKRDAKVENKIPWVGDLPYVGALFRYRTQTRAKTELVIILTPHVIRNKADAERVLAEEARKMDWILPDVLKIHGNHGLDVSTGSGLLATPGGLMAPGLPAGSPLEQLPQPGPRTVVPPPPTPLPGNAGAAAATEMRSTLTMEPPAGVP